MSRLQEYEAKKVVARYGIPVPTGRLCVSEVDIAAAVEEIGVPLYVKAQVAIGERKAAGAIKRVDDRQTAGAVARSLLASTFAGQAPAGVLVEQALEAHGELYMSVSISELDRSRRLVIATSGGSGFDAGSADLDLLINPVAGVPPAFAVRNLLRKAGFTGPTLVDLTSIAHGLARCAAEVQVYTAELNPVLLTDEGPVAVDAKLELDDYAARLRPGISVTESGSERELLAAAVQRTDHRGTLRYVQMIEEDKIASLAAIGTHSVGGGESLVVLDALAGVDLAAANYCDTSGSPSAEKVTEAARLIAGQPGIVGYFFCSCIANQPLSVTANGLVAGLDAAGWRGPTVVRIAGNEEDEARKIIADWAARNGVQAEIFGHEINEWQAADAMSRLLREKAVT